MSTKRRLTLMPEILPTPQIAAGAASSVRNRTLARLKVLAAVGAAGLAASCGRTLDDSGIGGDSGLPDGGREAGEDAYGVVDPLPPPSCFRNALPVAAVKYITDADAGDDAGADAGASRLVEVTLTFQQSGVVVGTVTPTQATLVESSSTMQSARLVLQVSSLATQAGAQVQVSCSTGPSAIRLDLTLTPTDVSVIVSESF
ncbi:hypothetical protein BH11MYX4_BH11MYX4_24570 [soil metagenome]